MWSGLKGISCQPRQLWVLCFGKAWDTYSYFGTQTILVLYMMHVYGYGQNASYAIYGAYEGLAFSLPVLGGFIADKLLGTTLTLFIGAILNIVGNFLLFSGGVVIFQFALALTLVGAGLYKSTSTRLVGCLYSDPLKKEGGFTWFYLSSNIGGTLAPLLYGVIVSYLAWSYVFLCSGCLILLGNIWLFFNLSLFKDLIKENIKIALSQITISALLISVVCVAIAAIFYFHAAINLLLPIVFVLGIVYLLAFSLKNSDQDRQTILGLFCVSLFGMIYFIISLQIGTVITLYVQQQIHAGRIPIHFPASAFSMFYCLFVLVLAPIPILCWKWLGTRDYQYSALTKILFGIVFAILGIMVFGIVSSLHQPLLGILIGIMFLSLGELVLIPAVYALISNKSPENARNSMMGCWLFFAGFGGYLGSVLSSLGYKASTSILGFSPSEYTPQFVIIAAVAMCMLIVLIRFRKRVEQFLVEGQDHAA